MSRRRPRGTAWLILAAAIAGMLAAWLTWTRAGDPALYPPPPGEAGVVAHVLDNGFHADLALPRARLEATPGPLAEAVRALPPGDWVLAGWGDARFYADTSPVRGRLLDGARALLRRDDPTVVMLSAWASEPAPRADRQRLRLSEAGFERLRARLEATLETRDGRPVIGPRRPGSRVRFYRSGERFWLGRVCNHWTAELLHAAGLPVRPAWTAFSGEVLAMARRAAALDSAAAGD